MDETVTRKEHEEFARRIDEENNRQNKRLEILEDTVRQIAGLATSVEKLATSMESMVKEQEKQGKRLEVLEGRDGEKWRNAVWLVISTVIGIAIGYILTQLGM